MSANALRTVLVSLISVLVGVMLVAIGFLGHVVLDRNSEDGEAPRSSAAAVEGAEGIDPALLDQIIQILADDFVEPERVNRDVLYQGAIQGIFTALNDPHSTYIDPRTYALSRDDFSGAFQGIGATVAREDNYVIIQAPLPGTPAERAGLKAGDRLIAVDGESAEGWTVEKAVLKIRGPKGSSVELRIRHRDGKEDTYTIVRDEVLVASVDSNPPGGALRDSSGNEAQDIGYIRIRTFTSRTPQELQEAVRAATRRGVKGLILDVRSNPGGLLVETAQSADFFLDKGNILSQVNRAGDQQRLDARPGTITDLPVVVVQDEFSASGSEVLAAALQENGRGKVVGTKSFGKGTVNHVRQLPNGGAVYVSIARWLTPSGNQIEGRGVTPDVEITVTPEDVERGRDVAVQRAIEVLRTSRPS